MKLFIVAALIAVAAAGRLEHLERSYLPPDNNGGHQGFGSSGSNGFGSSGSHGFGSSGSNGFGSSSHGTNGFHSSNNGFGSNLGRSNGGFGGHSLNGIGASHGSNGNGAFGGATSNQYLPPDHGPSGSSSNGFNSFGRSAIRSGPSFGSSGFGSSGSSGFGSSGSSGFGSSGSQGHFNSQPQFGVASASASRQYLAPRASSSLQNPPQQAFDEQTGYHY